MVQLRHQPNPDPSPVGLLDQMRLGSPSWMRDGACREVGGDWWFSPYVEDQRKAQAVCRDCPVRAQCLAWALGVGSAGERFGVWGGMTEMERRKARRKALRNNRKAVR